MTRFDTFYTYLITYKKSNITYISNTFSQQKLHFKSQKTLKNYYMIISSFNLNFEKINK